MTGVTTDPLAPLLALADIATAVEQARERFDQALGHRALRRHGGQVAAEVSLRSAVASAALEGAVHEREAVRAGTVTDPLLQGALRVAGALPGLSELWPKAPAGSREAARPRRPGVGAGIRAGPPGGRPRGRHAAGRAGRAGRRWHEGVAAGAGCRRTRGVVEPASVRRAVRRGGPGAARLVLLASGLDPRGLLAVDVGHREREPEYVGSAGAFATGTPDGLRSWLRHYMAAVEVGADQLTVIGDEILAAA